MDSPELENFSDEDNFKQATPVANFDPT